MQARDFMFPIYKETQTLLSGWVSVENMYYD